MSVATEMRDKYIAAEVAVLEGKSAVINGRSLTMENLSEIRAGRLEWEGRVKAEMAGIGGNRIGGLGFSVARMD